MKYAFFFLVVVLASLISCKNNNTNAADKPAEDSSKVFPVTDFIKREIEEVNKTPYFIYKLEESNGKKDSSAINIAIFNQLSASFLPSGVAEENLKSNYKESIFEDQTTNTFTISYAATDKQLEVQNIEILLKEDAQTVKRIFIRKFFNYADSSAIEQLSWKPGESFRINRSVQKEDNTENTRQTAIVWNQKK